MSLVSYLGFVLLTVVLAVVVKWYDPDTTAQLARQTGVSGLTGWIALLVALLWIFLPVLAGADIGEEAWVVGAALGAGGVFCCTVALASVDEYRLLTGTDHSAAESVTTGVEPSVTATTGRPTAPEDDEVTTIKGTSAVYTDWIVQERTRTATRRGWSTITGGVAQTPFTLGDGTVSVDGDQYRVFSGAEELTSFYPDEPLPEPVSEFFESHGELPQPAARTNRIQIVESYLPVDEPVTVVGTPTQGPRPGTVEIDGAPPDTLGGGVGSSEELSAGEPILIRGRYEDAKQRLTRRVYWLGLAGALLTVGGQALAFWLSSASLAALL